MIATLALSIGTLLIGLWIGFGIGQGDERERLAERQRQGLDRPRSGE